MVSSRFQLESLQELKFSDMDSQVEVQVVSSRFQLVLAVQGLVWWETYTSFGFST